MSSDGRTLMLEAHGLSHRVGTKQLFADLTLLGEAGQLLVVTGPSGAGKSTLLRLLGGLDRLGGSGSGSGSVAVGGTDIGSLRGGGLRRHLRNTVGYAFQDAGLVEHWTVARNLRAAARARSATPAMPPSTVVQAARRLDVAPLLPAHAHTLSGGERQRVALAALLTRMTPVMLVDEPTAALDRSLAHRVIGVLQELARGGALVIAASHDADLVDVADTVIRLG